MPLRPQLLEVLVQPLGPRAASHKLLDISYFEPRIAVEDALADHVHQRDHGLKVKAVMCT